MSVYFTSDLHFGHVNIHKFRPEFLSEQQHQEAVVKEWQSKITKRDVVYVLGDAAFTMAGIDAFAPLPGIKYLIRGNHDLCNTWAYLKVFKEVYGIVKYKEFWLSHAPIHPDELRGKVNLHGHVHKETIRAPFHPALHVKQELDKRYFNCCLENLWEQFNSSFVELDQLRKHLNDRLNL